jgi:N-acetylmuramic acid 6-phosphate etherase
MEKITEQDSEYRHLEKMSTSELLKNINQEDKKVAIAVEKVIPRIAGLVDAIYLQLSKGGRLFYIGAGTSGRLGILDASECPPTFGVPHEMVIGIIAGGDGAIRKAVEFAEDSTDLAWTDLSEFGIGEEDFVIGIAASGTTPYVVNGLKKCQENGIPTGSVCCNPNSPVARYADFPIDVIVGPEFVTGSTRMKSGTAQKMILNMITTGVMVKLGRVMDNKMVDMQLSNQKLVERGTLMIMEKSALNSTEALKLLKKSGSVRNALKALDAIEKRS